MKDGTTGGTLILMESKVLREIPFSFAKRPSGNIWSFQHTCRSGKGSPVKYEPDLGFDDTPQAGSCHLKIEECKCRWIP